jgi:hypothetical protein
MSYGSESIHAGPPNTWESSIKYAREMSPLESKLSRCEAFGVRRERSCSLPSVTKLALLGRTRLNGRHVKRRRLAG